MKRTPWRGVLKNECNKSSGSFGARTLTLWRAGQSGAQPLVDEICVLCGYERKYASKLLRGGRPIARKREVSAEARRGFTLRRNAK